MFQHQFREDSSNKILIYAFITKSLHFEYFGTPIIGAQPAPKYSNWDNFGLKA